MFGKPPPGKDALRQRLARVSAPKPDKAAAAPFDPGPPLAQARADRRNVFRNASLLLPDGHKFTVAVKNLSENGARIEFFVQLELSGIVTLIEPTMRLRKRARVVWACPGAAGLAFVED